LHREKAVPSLRPSRADFRKSAEAVLISRYTPASVVVDEHMEVVNINGSVAPFLEPSPGRPTHELMKMVRKELAFELRNALHKAKQSQETVIKEGIPVKHDGDTFSATIEIVPLTDTVDSHYLILFCKKSPDTSFFKRAWKKLKPTFALSEKNRTQQRVTALERELEQAREDMRSISEEQEAYSEELQSANEELWSANEEQQSVNEELGTSKEELQSTNEELIVLNREILEKQGEQERSMEYLDAVIATLREPFVVLGKDLRIQSANASYYKRFDVDETETEGQPFFEVRDSMWDNSELLHLLQEVLPKKQRIVDEEIVLRSPSGAKRSFMFNAREIFREKEYGKSILLSIEDITERKMTEGYKDTIIQLNITNDKLDKYVHVASHDLQEPLRKIMIFSDRLIGKGAFGDPEDMETLKKIASSAQRMSGLIKGLLEYARLSNHRQQFEQTDLNEILKAIRTDFELLIEEKGAQLKIGELPVLEAISLQMNQLFYNLIGNALKFSREGVSPIVEIGSHPYQEKEVKKHPSLPQGLSYHELIVKDNGIGFEQKYGKQIFIIFQRLRQSRYHTGTGIGLSLAKKIVENHHGEIYAVSEEGKGAAFHVILPVEQPG
jgi:two-component system CheB/CheR fusion protein